MTALRRAAIVAGCALSLLAVLETLRWVRASAIQEAREAAPFARMDDAGVVTLERIERFVYDDVRGREDVRHVYDRSGRLVSSSPIKHLPSDGNPGTAAWDGVSKPSNPWVVCAGFDARFRDGSAAASTVWALDFAEGWRNGYPNPYTPARMRAERPWRSGKGPPRAWSFEDGRFVCRDLENGGVLAGFGPDGYATGPAGAEGAQFSSGLESPTGPYAFSSVLAPQDGVLFDAEAKRVYFLRAEWPPLQPRSITSPEPGPVPIRVTAVAVEGPAGERVELAAHEEEGWLWRFNPPDAAEPAVPLRAGPDLVIVRASGATQRIVLAADDRDLTLTEVPSCIATTLAPVGSPVAHIRIRRLLDGGEIVGAAVDTVPVTTRGRVAAASVGVVTWLRPPALNVVSFAGPRVEDYADYFGRLFTDGVIAGGDGAGWLAGSLGVGAICAALVRRQALRRAPRRATLWTMIGAALGPLAFVWMRIAMPTSHVTSCACGRRRAVHLTACPTCSSSWPAPAPTGIEVFA